MPRPHLCNSVPGPSSVRPAPPDRVQERVAGLSGSLPSHSPSIPLNPASEREQHQVDSIVGSSLSPLPPKYDQSLQTFLQEHFTRQEERRNRNEAEIATSLQTLNTTAQHFGDTMEHLGDTMERMVTTLERLETSFSSHLSRQEELFACQDGLLACQEALYQQAMGHRSRDYLYNSRQT